MKSSIRWFDWMAALSLMVAAIAAANRLVSTHWVAHLELIRFVTFLGIVAGLALGQSRFHPRLAGLFGALYGVFVVGWQLGLTIEKVELWTHRLVVLIWRLIFSTAQLMVQEDVQDPILFLFLMTCLFWGLSVHAGYTLTRHAHPWRATLPLGLTLLVIHLSDPTLPGRAWWLAAYLACLLMLLARADYLHRHAHWQKNRMILPPYVGLDLARAAFQIAIALVLLAWLAPPLTQALGPLRETWTRVTKPWDEIVERLDNLFAPLRSDAGVAYTLYGDMLSLGNGVPLTDEVLLNVEVPRDPPLRVRYYWRARVYDHYADGEWSTRAFTLTQPVAPRFADLAIPDVEQRWTAMFTFTTPAPLSTLYLPPQPLWVNRFVEVTLAPNPGGTVDTAVWRAEPNVPGQELYRARSSISAVTIAQLRAAGQDYPSWVTERYLQLPSTVTSRTLELAREIARGQETPYDIAAAVTGYLRTHITFQETVPDYPRRQEPLDWFLFDLQEGFCNYYASAEVVMLRALGVPARLAVGFAQGERQSGSNLYVVRRRDAHAWPEVYFPGLGWIEFEPTTSQAPIIRPSGEPTEAGGGGSPMPPLPGEFGGLGDLEEELERLRRIEEGDLGGEGATTSPWRATAYIGAMLGLGVAAAILARRARRRRGSPPLVVQVEAGLRRLGVRPPAFLRRQARRALLPPLARSYLEINYALARLGAPPVLAATPTERAARLARLLPEAAEPAQRLVAEYHAAIYSPHAGDLSAAQQAGRAIRLLSWQARLRRLFLRA